MKYRVKKFLFIVFIDLVCLAVLHPYSFQGNQQTASTIEPPRTVDLKFHYSNSNPAYPRGMGPVVLVDEAHNNFHTSMTTYLPFARLLTEDGYVVKRGLNKILDPLPVLPLRRPRSSSHC